jgi:hypothetical protein
VDVASGGDRHKCHTFCSLRIDAEIEEDEEEAYEEEKERRRILVTIVSSLPFWGFLLPCGGRMDIMWQDKETSTHV